VAIAAKIPASATWIARIYLSRWPSGEWVSGELRLEPGKRRAEPILAEKWRGWGWTEEELGRVRQNARGKMAIAARWRRATTLTLKWLAVRIGLEMSQSAKAKVHQWLRNHPNPSSAPSSPPHQPLPTILKQECAQEKNHATA
jgi:hypothetical protein